MQTLCKSFLMSEEFEGSLGHNLHNCISRIDFGFCPLCVVKCVVKLIAWKDARSHLLRLFDFSPVFFKCLLKCHYREVAKSHKLHFFRFLDAIASPSSYPHLCQSCQSC